MFITRPQSSPDASTTSVVAGCSKDNYNPVHRIVLTPGHQSHGDGRPPTRKVGFYCSSIRENRGFFLNEKEDKRENEAIRRCHHDPLQAQCQQEGYLSSNYSTLAESIDVLVLDSASSTITDGLKRLHDCMARTTESRRLLARAHALSNKETVELRAITRRVLTGGIDLHRIALAGYQDCSISSNTSPAVVRGHQSSHTSKRTTPSLVTSKRHRSVVQKQQARQAMKEHKRASMSRTGVAFRSCMAGMLDCV